VFDIDGTLSPEISWTELTRQLGASVDAHLKIFNQYRHQDITYEQSRVQLISLWRETGHAKRDNIVSIFKSFAIRPEAAPLIRRLTRDGFELCVITGSFDLYAQVVASKLGIITAIPQCISIQTVLSQAMTITAINQLEKLSSSWNFAVTIISTHMRATPWATVRAISAFSMSQITAYYLRATSNRLRSALQPGSL
jgi:phosphoserine phosphatase